VISNCVINLCPDKESDLREIYRVLKAGGEFYFSDVYSDRRIPTNLLDDPVLYGECLSGALYEGDFIRLARKHGFNDPREVARAPASGTISVSPASCGLRKPPGWRRYWLCHQDDWD
jgi:arsenite methyltransferase